MVKDDVVQKLLYDFAFLLCISAKEEEALRRVLWLVAQVEALLLFIYIIEFVLQVRRVCLEAGQQCFSLALSPCQHLHSLCFYVVDAELVGGCEAELALGGPLGEKGPSWTD